jgi:hypothetical protein
VYSHDNGCGRLLVTGLPLGRFATASGANSTKVVSSCAVLPAAGADAAVLPAGAAAAVLPAGGVAPLSGAGLTAAGVPWPRICLLASILARVSQGTPLMHRISCAS